MFREYEFDCREEGYKVQCGWSPWAPAPTDALEEILLPMTPFVERLVGTRDPRPNQLDALRVRK